MRFLSLIPALFLVACSGGGGGDTAAPPAPATERVQEWYDAPANTQLKSDGWVLAGTTTKHGVWTSYFAPADGGRVQSQQVWANGQWDETQAWEEFNADGSLRVTSEDR